MLTNYETGEVISTKEVRPTKEAKETIRHIALGLSNGQMMAELVESAKHKDIAKLAWIQRAAEESLRYA